MKALQLLLLLVVLALGACATPPKTIDGRDVIGTRIVEGRRVYILEGDTVEDTRRRGAETSAAASGVRFAPTLPPASATSPQPVR